MVRDTHVRGQPAQDLQLQSWHWSHQHVSFPITTPAVLPHHLAWRRLKLSTVLKLSKLAGPVVVQCFPEEEVMVDRVYEQPVRETREGGANSSVNTGGHAMGHR